MDEGFNDYWSSIENVLMLVRLSETLAGRLIGSRLPLALIHRHKVFVSRVSPHTVYTYKTVGERADRYEEQETIGLYNRG